MRVVNGLAAAPAANIVLSAGLRKLNPFPPSPFVSANPQNMRAADFRFPSTDSQSGVDFLVRIESEVSTEEECEWQYRPISLNWNANTSFSKVNYTKRCCTSPQMTWKSSS